MGGVTSLLHPHELPKQLPRVRCGPRVTMWNTVEMRKISGNSAPKAQNVQAYMKRHPNMVVYDGTQHGPGENDGSVSEYQPRVTIWNKKERKCLSGNAAPLAKNLEKYLRKHPECEVYTGQANKAKQMLAPTTAAPYCMEAPKSLEVAEPPTDLAGVGMQVTTEVIGCLQEASFTDLYEFATEDIDMGECPTGFGAAQCFGWDQQLYSHGIDGVETPTGSEWEGMDIDMDIDMEAVCVPAPSLSQNMESTMLLQAPWTMA